MGFVANDGTTTVHEIEHDRAFSTDRFDGENGTLMENPFKWGKWMRDGILNGNAFRKLLNDAIC